MARHANTGFETSLRTAVKRLAKGNFENAIREVAEHYQDLIDESLAQGKTLEQSTALAVGRIGVVGDIARKIVDSPARVKTGIRLQWLAAILWMSTPFVSWQVFRHIAPFRNPVSLPDPFIVMVGILAIAGGFRASKVAWKPIVSAFAFFGAISTYQIVRSAPNVAIREAKATEEQHLRNIAGLEHEKFETAMAPCLASFKEVGPSDLERLRTTLLSVNKAMPAHMVSGPGIPYSSKNKWVFPYEYRYEPGEVYLIDFGTTNSLADAQMMWRKMENVNAQWNAMVADRKSFTRLGYSTARMEPVDRFQMSLPRPAMLAFSISISIFLPFLYGFLFGGLLLRIYVYRLDLFKLRRI